MADDVNVLDLIHVVNILDTTKLTNSIDPFNKVNDLKKIDFNTSLLLTSDISPNDLCQLVNLCSRNQPISLHISTIIFGVPVFLHFTLPRRRKVTAEMLLQALHRQKTIYCYPIDEVDYMALTEEVKPPMGYKACCAIVTYRIGTLNDRSHIRDSEKYFDAVFYSPTRYSNVVARWQDTGVVFDHIPAKHRGAVSIMFLIEPDKLLETDDFELVNRPRIKNPETGI